MDIRRGPDKLLTCGAGLLASFLENSETLMLLLIDAGLELTKQLRTEGCE